MIPTARMMTYQLTTAPSKVKPVVGRMVGSGCGVVPKARSIADSAISSTPSEETIFDRGEELRSGRKTANSTSAPQATANSKASGSAAAVGKLAILPEVSAQKA